MSKIRALRTWMPTRARRVPFGASIFDTSTAPSRSSRPAVGTTLLSPYIGWKQPAVRPARAIAASTLAIMPRNDNSCLSDHIDDPLRDDDDLFRALAVERLLYRIEGQNGSLDLVFSSVPGDGHVGPFPAVDLHRQGDRGLDQQRRLELRPGLGGGQGLVPERRPALLGQMRHHRMEQPHQDVAGLAQREGEVSRRRGLDMADRVG